MLRTDACSQAYEASRVVLSTLKFGVAAEGLKSDAEGTALLDKSFHSDDQKLRALLSAIRAPAKGAQASEGVKMCVRLLEKLATPLLRTLEHGIAALAKQGAAKAPAAGADAEASAAGSAADAPPAAPALTPEETEALLHLEHAQRTLTAPLHSKLVSDAHDLRSPALFERAVAAAAARTGPYGDLRAGAERLTWTAELLTALHAFEGVELAFPDLTPALPLADALSAHLPMAGAVVGDILATAALTLFRATKPMIDRLFSLNYTPDQTVERVLQALFSAFAATRFSDSIIYTDIALKLGSVLEARDENSAALAVLREAKRRVEADRAGLIHRHRHAPNEPFFSLTADRSQPTEEVAALVAGLSEQDRTLTCLHADLLLLLTRVELRVGLTEQGLQATKRVARLEDTLRKRDDQAAIFGKRTERERREDDTRVQDAAQTPPNPRLTERRLLAEADRNLYEKAVILMTMAEFRDPAGKDQALRECVDVLHQIERSEATLIKAAQAAPSPPTKVASLPPVPQIISRTPTTVTLLPPRGFRPKGDGKATQYAIYGKAFGAGTSVQMNAIAAQYENLGVKFNLNERCVVRGLKPNDSYTFAIAYFDEQGRVIGELGHSSPEIPMVLPVPLFYLWSQLVITACRLGALGVARTACSVLWRHFVITNPEKPIWDANPMDAEELHPSHAAVAISPVLRAFAQCSYLWSDRLGGGETGEGAPAPSPDADPFKRAYQDGEIALLKRAKRIIIGLESATLVADEGLICEGAVRLYNCLGPLIAQSSKSRMLSKGLLGCYAALQAVHDVTWCKRSLAGSVAVRAVYHLIDLCDDLNETGLRDLVAKSSLPLIEAVRTYRDGPPEHWEARLGSLDAHEKALLDLQAEELRHLTEFLLQHKDAMAMSSATGVFKAPDRPPEHPVPEKKDAKAPPPPPVIPLSQPPSEFMAKMLSQLATEPKLGLTGLFGLLHTDEEAKANPRYIEAIYRLCERAHQRHMHAEVGTWVDHIVAVNKELLTPAAPPVPRPEPLVLPPLPAAPLAEGEEPPSEGGSAPPEPQPEVVKVWTVAAALELLRRTDKLPSPEEIDMAGSAERVVAAKFLQSRWRLYAARRKALLKTRRAAAQNGPWVARAAALQAFSCATQAKDIAATAAVDKADIAKGITTRPAVIVVDPTVPPPKIDPKKGPPPPPPEVPIPAPADTLKSGLEKVNACIRAAARAVEWSARAHFPWELLSGCKRLHNLLRRLLVPYKDLMLEPVEKGYWAVLTPEGTTVPISNPLPAASPIPVPRRGESRLGAAIGPQLTRKISQRSMSAGQHSVDEQDLQGLEDQLDDDRMGEDAMPQGRLVMVPAAPNLVRLLRVPMIRMLQMVEQMKDGSLQLHAGMLPMPTQPSDAELAVVGAFPGSTVPGARTSGGGLGGTGVGGFAQFYPTQTAGRGVTFAHATMEFGTKRPATAADSHFSFGSDLVPELWYVSIPALDVKWSSKFVLQIMGIAQQMGFYGTVFTAGDRFNRLTEGHMALDILPAVKQACGILGINLVPYQLALDAAIRDKNQALEELEKCRALVRGRFADRSPFSFERDQRMQKKKKRAVNFKDGASNRGGSHAAQSQFDTSSQFKVRDIVLPRPLLFPALESSLLPRFQEFTSSSKIFFSFPSCAQGGSGSVYSGQTSRSATTRSIAASDSTNLMVQYRKVIELLEAKGEKWLKAEALNELGDAYAHQAEWDQATLCWSDAVDLMMGPYQCIKSWRTDLGHLTPSDMLARYGAPCILLSLVLLGKLAHFSYVSHLTMRLECAALGAELAHALFTCSAVHPQRKLEFAGYRCEEIWAGKDLFEDAYKCSLADLQMATEVLGRVLLANHLALDALPVLCLMDHVARKLTRDPLRVAYANLLRAEACAAEGRLTEASAALLHIVLGVDLPDPTTSLNQLPPGGSVPELVSLGGNNASSGGGLLADRHLYDKSQRPSHPQNRAVIERLLTFPLHEQLVKRYGAELVGLIQIARARFVLAACKETELFFDCDPVSGELVVPPVEEPVAAPAPLDKKGALKVPKDSKTNLKDEKPVEKKVAAGKKGADAHATPTDASAGGLFVGDVGSFEGQSLQAAVALLHTSRASLRDVTGSTSDERMLVSTMNVTVLSDLALCDLRSAQMLPDQALGYAISALLLLSKDAGEHLSDFGREIRASAPEFVIRNALLAEPWCNAVARAAELCFDLGQVGRAMSAIEAGLEAAAILKCDRLAQRLQGIRVCCLFAQGRTFEGLKEAQALEGRMKRSCAPPLELATLRFQSGEVLDALGLRADSAAQYEQATLLLRHHLTLRGLYSPATVPFAAPSPSASLARRRFEEVLSLTVPGSALFIECLLRESRAQFRKKRFQLATDLAREALDVTPRARVTPQVNAACALHLAWCLRHLATTATAEGDKEGALQDLTEASRLLHQSIRWAAMDGGHSHDHLHRCYCEIVLVQQQRADLLKGSPAEYEDARARAVKAVVGALKVAGQRDRLLLSPQTLQGFKRTFLFSLSLLIGSLSLTMHPSPDEPNSLLSSSVVRMLFHSFTYKKCSG